jgi:hypothetical protein
MSSISVHSIRPEGPSVNTIETGDVGECGVLVVGLGRPCCMVHMLVSNVDTVCGRVRGEVGERGDVGERGEEGERGEIGERSPVLPGTTVLRCMGELGTLGGVTDLADRTLLRDEAPFRETGLRKFTPSSRFLAKKWHSSSS